MTTALFIGRFQPVHKGHLLVIKEILESCDEIIIGIGSSEKANVRDNPFLFQERKEMLEISLTEANISNYKIIPVPDVGNDTLWIGQIIKNAPKFEVIYTNNEWTKKCFEKKGIEARETAYFEPYNGSDIRLKIGRDEPWQDLVPPAAISYIEKINGITRIKQSLE